jgi:hypothetical protein
MTLSARIGDLSQREDLPGEGIQPEPVHGDPAPGENLIPAAEADLIALNAPKQDVSPARLVGHRPTWLSDVALPKVKGTRVRARPQVASSSPVRPLYIQIPDPFGGPNTPYPYSTIGRVFTGTNPDLKSWDWSGSGVLVGPNLLLTASHVAPWAATGLWWMKFVAAYEDGTGEGSSYVQTVYGVPRYQDGSGADTGHDVAICRLYTPLGETCGWMGWESWHDLGVYETLNNALLSVGYPGSYQHSEEPVLNYFPNLHDTDDDGDGAIELECDDFAGRGWSGGPLFGNINGGWRVVGVDSDEQAEYIFPFSSEDVSVFAGGSWMGGLIQYGLQNWPVGPGKPAAPGSVLDGYVQASDDSQHVNFIGQDGHVHELLFRAGATNWADTDLTANAGATLPVPGSALDGYWQASDDSQHVNFIGQDDTSFTGLSGHVHELIFHAGATNWADTDLTANAGAIPPAAGSALDGYVQAAVLIAGVGGDNSQHVNFIGQDGHVHELIFRPGATNWADTNLTANAGATPPAAGSAVDGYHRVFDDSQHVNFISQDGHVHELLFRAGATNWADTDLTANA